MAIPGASTVSHEREWITPDEQLRRLLRETHISDYQSAIEIISQYRSSHVAGQPHRSSCPRLIDLAMSRISDWHINWYQALFHLNKLPLAVPPLPENIRSILESPCPFHTSERKPNGDPYAIKDTSILMLIPEEFETLEQLEKTTAAYGRIKYPPEEYNGRKIDRNPLKIANFSNYAYRECANVPFSPTHWVLITKDVIDGSLDKTYEDQVALIEDVNRDHLENYQVPSIQQLTTAVLLHKIATGVSLYPYVMSISPYTRVREKTKWGQIEFGGFEETGLTIFHGNENKPDDRIGLAALRTFGQEES